MVGLVQGVWLLLYHQYWTLKETGLGYPAVDPSHGDPAAMVQQDRPLHALQHVIDGVDVGAGQLTGPDLGLCDS